MLAHPEHLFEIVKARRDNSTVIIDEIQKVPQLLETVHSIMEQKRNIQFILTGSSARKLRRSSANLLGGRAYNMKMLPFSYSEIKNECNFSEILEFGTIPVIVRSDDKLKALLAYIDLYLREEILNEGLTRNIENFSRFLEAISFSHASLLNISNVARDCDVPRKTVGGYLEILKDLLIVETVPVFTKRAKRKLVSHEKMYFFDTGLFRQLRPRGPFDRVSEIDGAALEGLVFQHLKAWIIFNDKRDKLYFWRTKNGNEVDFIIYGESGIRGIEVKNSDTIRLNDLNGLKSFKKDYPEAELFLLYRGKETFIRDEIKVMPCEDYISDI
jgi:predicted AAA+ superfamily ATPase